MNRNALNSVPLGSGNSLPFIFAAAQQVLRLAGALSAHVRKYAPHTAQSVKLIAEVRAYRQVFSGSVQRLRLVPVFFARVLRRVRGAATQRFLLTTSVKGVRRAVAKANQKMRIVYIATVHALHFLRVPISQVLRLRTSITANDFTTQPAPLERTSGRVDISTRVAPQVLIGDQ